MSTVKEIKSSLEILKSDMDWLGKSINMEEDIDELKDRFWDADLALQDLTEKVNNLIGIL